MAWVAGHNLYLCLQNCKAVGVLILIKLPKIMFKIINQVNLIYQLVALCMPATWQPSYNFPHRLQLLPRRKTTFVTVLWIIVLVCSTLVTLRVLTYLTCLLFQLTLIPTYSGGWLILLITGHHHSTSSSGPPN